MTPQLRQQIIGLVALLLVQLGTGPACCLALSSPHAAHAGAGGFALIGYGSSHHRHPDDPAQLSVLHDHLCSACHALGHGVVPAGPNMPPLRVAWSAPPPWSPADPHVRDRVDAHPGQPRAPPSFC